jgi:hypothetical protein
MNIVDVFLQQQKKMTFFVFDYKCRTLLVVANASTKFNDAILFAVMSKGHNNRTLLSIVNVKVKVVLFSGVVMVFSLQAQWWDAIPTIFSAIIFSPLLLGSKCILMEMLLH